MLQAAREKFVVAVETLAENDFARILEYMYHNPQCKAYLFAHGQNTSPVVRNAVNNGMITLGPRERHWYRTSRGRFIRISPDDNIRDKLASIVMHTRQRIFMTHQEKIIRNRQQRGSKVILMNGLRKFAQHYHKYEHLYYLLGLALTVIGIGITLL